jgi:hypothetical protein
VELFRGIRGSDNMMMKGILVFFVAILFSEMVIGFAGAETNQTFVPDDVTLQIIDTLTQADQISLSEDAETQLEMIQSVSEKINNSTGLLNTYVASGDVTAKNASVLTNYLDIWSGVITIYGSLIQGGIDKQDGYNYLLGNDTDRYEKALDAFRKAHTNYRNALETLNQTEQILNDFDSSALRQILPEVAIPEDAVLSETRFRIIDTSELCQAYQDLCRAKIENSTINDVNATKVQEPLIAATTRMKGLSFSPYVGEEASLFANITLS